MLSYNLPWSPQKYNVSGHGSGWFSFWKWVEEGISAALMKYLHPFLSVKSSLPCSSHSAELLETLNGIAADGFFLLSLHNFSSLDGKQMYTSHHIGIASLKPDG